MRKRIFLLICLFFALMLLNEFTHQTPIITDGPSMLLFLGTGLIVLAGPRKSIRKDSDVMKMAAEMPLRNTGSGQLHEPPLFNPTALEDSLISSSLRNSDIYEDVRSL
jgi:hypothetical protein